MEKSAKNIYREKKTTNIYGSSMPTNNIVPFLFPAKCHSFPSKLHLFPLQEIEHMVDTVLEMLPCMDWKAFQHAPKEKLLIIFFFSYLFWGERESERSWWAANNAYRDSVEWWQFHLLFMGSALLELRLWWWINWGPHSPIVVGTIRAKNSINYTAWAVRNLFILALVTVRVIMGAIIGIW